MVTEQSPPNTFFQEIHKDAIFRTTRHVGLFHVIRATFKKEMTKFMSYRANFIGEFIQVFIFMLVFYFFSQALILNDLPSTSKSTVFLFYICGMIMIIYNDVAFWAPFTQTRDDVYNGTLEAIYINPSSRYGYFVGGALAQSVFNSVFAIPFLVLSFILSGINLVDGIMMVIAVIATVTVYMSIGIIVGLSVILWKEVGSIVNVLNLLIQFATGVLIPFSSLPQVIQIISFIFPTTFGLDILRSYAFGDVWDPIMPIYLLWAALGLQLVIYLGLSQILMRKVERKAKKSGLHLI